MMLLVRDEVLSKWQPAEFMGWCAAHKNAI